MTIAYCPKRAALLCLVSAWVAFLASPGLASAQGHHAGASGLPHNIPDFCEAATVRSVGSGAWSSPATWSAGRAPVAGEGVSIGEGTTVTYDVVSNAALACVDVHGALRFRTDINTRLTVGTLEVLPSGSIEIGTQASPVAAGVTAEIVIADRPLNTSTDPEQYGTGFIAFGRVRIHGASKSPTFDRLTREPTAGSTALTATRTLAGWAAGDRLVIPDSRHLKWDETGSRFSLQCEELTLGTASGAQLNLTSALRFNHPGARNGDGVLEFLPHVGNLTRNVIVRSQSPTGTRGHVIFSGRADVDVRYALFKDLGRTTVAPLDSTTFDAGGHPTHIGTNQIGRYSLHLHHLMGPSAAPSSGYQYVLSGNAIDGGTKWGIAIHNTHYGLVSDNVMYNIGGAFLMAEDGSESYNVIERNFGLRGFGTGSREAGGREGIGFYFRGPNNYVRDNVAATLTNDDSHGYKYFLIYLGNIRIPNFPGADTTVSGQYTVRSAYEIPVREFARNEVYGATPKGLSYFWVGSESQTPKATEPSIFKDVRVWHVYNQGVVQYPSSNIVLDGLVVRGVLHATACCSTGYDGGDYDADRFVIRNADIQGMSTGIFISAASGRSRVPQRVENSYLRNQTNLAMGTMHTSSYSAAGIQPRQVIVTDSTFATPAGVSGTQAIDLWYRSDPTRDLVTPDELRVYNYNRQAGNNFRVYYSEQAPGFIVPRTILNSDNTPSLLGSPVTGLTNQQNWLTYGIAIAGAVAPCSTAMAGIDGLTCGISGSAPPRPPSPPSNVILTK